MKVRKFAASDMSDALQQIREELGPDAIILHAKQGEEGGFWKLFRRPNVEIVAALDDDTGGAEAPARPAVATGAPVTAETSAALREIQRALAELRVRVEAIATRSESVQVAHLGELLGAYYRHLRAQDVSEPLAYDVVHRVFQQMNPASLQSPTAVDARMRLQLAGLVTTSGPLRLTPGEPRVLAFVGPTGTGKTTFVAKLAAGFTLNEQRRVGLITTDTIRVAAIPQLRTYAEIMGLEVDVAYSEAELQALIRNHQDKDIILVDTPGRSPQDTEGIAEVGRFVRQIASPTVFLVLQAIAKASDLVQALDAFEPCGFTQLTVSKLDETAQVGPIFDLAAQSSRPIGFFGADQDVPGEVAVASAEELVDRLLDGFEPPEAAT